MLVFKSFFFLSRIVFVLYFFASQQLHASLCIGGNDYTNGNKIKNKRERFMKIHLPAIICTGNHVVPRSFQDS